MVIVFLILLIVIVGIVIFMQKKTEDIHGENEKVLIKTSDLSLSSLTVTNKRVYGKTLFGKRVDLPIDSISAVATSWWFMGINVGTSSGKIMFYFVLNRTEVYEVLNKEILKRSSGKKSTMVISNVSNAEELKKFKDLLDSGIISQEEFDAKKKQLLGL